MARTGSGGRPGVLRRAFAGAWQVPAGFMFLARRPRLWPLAAAPAVLATLGILLGLFLGVYLIHAAEEHLDHLTRRAGEYLSLALTGMLWIGILTAGVALGLAAALAIAAPLLDRLSKRTEQAARGEAPDHALGLTWELGQSLGSALYFLAAAPLVLLLNLIPLIGPLFGLTWGYWALALQLTEGPLVRRSKTFAERKQWHRQWRAETMGFGGAGLVVLLVPFANLLLAPVLAIGGTLLVLELEGRAADPSLVD